MWITGSLQKGHKMNLSEGSRGDLQDWKEDKTSATHNNVFYFLLGLHLMIIFIIN